MHEMLLRTQRFAIHVLKQNQVRIKCRIQHIYSFINEINLPRLTPFSLCVRKLDIVQLKSVFRWPLGHNIYLENQPIKIMILLDIWKLFVPRKPTFHTFQTDLWLAYVDTSQNTYFKLLCQIFFTCSENGGSQGSLILICFCE